MSLVPYGIDSETESSSTETEPEEEEEEDAEWSNIPVIQNSKVPAIAELESSDHVSAIPEVLVDADCPVEKVLESSHVEDSSSVMEPIAQDKAQLIQQEIEIYVQKREKDSKESEVSPPGLNSAIQDQERPQPSQSPLSVLEEEKQLPIENELVSFEDLAPIVDDQLESRVMAEPISDHTVPSPSSQLLEQNQQKQDAGQSRQLPELSISAEVESSGVESAPVPEESSLLDEQEQACSPHGVQLKQQGIKISFQKNLEERLSPPTAYRSPSSTFRSGPVPPTPLETEGTEELENVDNDAISVGLKNRNVIFGEECRGLAGLQNLSVEHFSTAVCLEKTVPDIAEDRPVMSKRSVAEDKSLAEETGHTDEKTADVCSLAPCEQSVVASPVLAATVQETKIESSPVAPFVRVPVIQKNERPKRSIVERWSEQSPKQKSPVQAHQPPLFDSKSFRIPKRTKKLSPAEGMSAVSSTQETVARLADEKVGGHSQQANEASCAGPPTGVVAEEKAKSEVDRTDGRRTENKGQKTSRQKSSNRQKLEDQGKIKNHKNLEKVENPHEAREEESRSKEVESRHTRRKDKPVQPTVVSSRVSSPPTVDVIHVVDAEKPAPHQEEVTSGSAAITSNQNQLSENLHQLYKNASGKEVDRRPLFTGSAQSPRRHKKEVWMARSPTKQPKNFPVDELVNSPSSDTQTTSFCRELLLTDRDEEADLLSSVRKEDQNFLAMVESLDRQVDSEMETQMEDLDSIRDHIFSTIGASVVNGPASIQAPTSAHVSTVTLLPHSPCALTFTSVPSSAAAPACEQTVGVSVFPSSTCVVTTSTLAVMTSPAGVTPTRFPTSSPRTPLLVVLGNIFLFSILNLYSTQS